MARHSHKKTHITPIKRNKGSHAAKEDKRINYTRLGIKSVLDPLKCRIEGNTGVRISRHGYKHSPVYDSFSKTSRKMWVIVLMSGLIVPAMSTAYAQTSSYSYGGVASAFSVSRSSERSSLTTETSGVKVSGDKWSINNDSYVNNVPYSPSQDQNNAKSALEQTVSSAQEVLDNSQLSRVSADIKNALQLAVDSAHSVLSNTKSSVEEYNTAGHNVTNALNNANTALTRLQQSQSRSSSHTTSSSQSASVSSLRSSLGSSAGAQIASTALNYVGSPYVYGGSSPTSGWDCSGFVAYVFAQYGISLPHYSGAQATYGQPVANLESAQVGDIIANSMHVGIYVGNGMVVNALNPQYGTVVTPVSTSFSGGYSIRRLV